MSSSPNNPTTNTKCSKRLRKYDTKTPLSYSMYLDSASLSHFPDQGVLGTYTHHVLCRKATHDTSSLSSSSAAMDIMTPDTAASQHLPSGLQHCASCVLQGAMGL